MTALQHIDLHWVDHGSPRYRSAVALRQRLLRTPLGRRFSPGDLAAEHDQLHLVAMDDDRVVAAAVLVPTSFTVRQVCVDPSVAGNGLGTRLMEGVVARARDLGATHLTCHARCTARSFYESLGWTADGPIFTEVGIDHVEMQTPVARVKSVS